MLPLCVASFVGYVAFLKNPDVLFGELVAMIITFMWNNYYKFKFK